MVRIKWLNLTRKRMCKSRGMRMLSEIWIRLREWEAEFKHFLVRKKMNTFLTYDYCLVMTYIYNYLLITYLKCVCVWGGVYSFCGAGSIFPHLHGFQDQTQVIRQHNKRLLHYVVLVPPLQIFNDSY